MNAFTVVDIFSFVNLCVSVCAVRAVRCIYRCSLIYLPLHTHSWCVLNFYAFARGMVYFNLCVYENKFSLFLFVVTEKCTLVCVYFYLHITRRSKNKPDVLLRQQNCWPKNSVSAHPSECYVYKNNDGLLYDVVRRTSVAMLFYGALSKVEKSVQVLNNKSTK